MTGETTRLGIRVRPAGGRLLEVALEALYRHQNQRQHRDRSLQLPMNAGEAILTVHHQAGILQPWSGRGVFCLYATPALTAGFIRITRRDA
jgi:hypothetical protein